jgi:hypothetical protein
MPPPFFSICHGQSVKNFDAPALSVPALALRHLAQKGLPIAPSVMRSNPLRSGAFQIDGELTTSLTPVSSTIYFIS